MQLHENKKFLELKKKKKEFLRFDIAASAAKPNRAKKFIFSFQGLILDISRQRIPTDALNKFLRLGNSQNIKNSVEILLRPSSTTWKTFKKKIDQNSVKKSICSNLCTQKKPISRH